MTDVAADMKEDIIRLAGPMSWKDTRASWLDRAADLAGISSRMARVIFYAEARPGPNTIARIKAALAKLNDEQDAKAAHGFERARENFSAVGVELGPPGPDADRERPDRDW